MPTLRERLDALEKRVNALEEKDEKPQEDDFERNYREHIERKKEQARADLARRTRVGMQSTSSGP